MHDQPCYETGYARHASGAINSKREILLTSSLVLAFLAAAVALVIVMAPVSPLAMVHLKEPGSMPGFVRGKAPAPAAPEAAADQAVAAAAPVDSGAGTAVGFAVPQTALAGVQAQPVFEKDDDISNRGKGKQGDREDESLQAAGFDNEGPGENSGKHRSGK